MIIGSVGFLCLAVTRAGDAFVTLEFPLLLTKWSEGISFNQVSSAGDVLSEQGGRGIVIPGSDLCARSAD